MAAKWFPFLATLFFFILFSNIIGLIPLPTNTEHPIDIFGLEVPAFALYAATANISIPLVLTLVVWIVYQCEGIRATDPSVPKTWLPAGIEDMNPIGKGLDVRDRGDLAVRPAGLAVGATVRQHPRRPPAAAVHGRRAGGTARPRALGVLTFPMAFAFYVFEIVIVAGLQAFIFSILTAIYLGEATSESH